MRRCRAWRPDRRSAPPSAYFRMRCTAGESGAPPMSGFKAAHAPSWRRFRWLRGAGLHDPVVDETDADGLSRDRGREALGESQRRAPFDGRIDRLAIDLPRFGLGAGARIGHERRSDDLAGAFETETHRHLHALL